MIVWPLSNPQLYRRSGTGVAPVADSTTRTYTVKVTLKDPPPSDPLRHEYRRPLEGQPALVVALPLSALFEKDGAPAVWVFDQPSAAPC